MGRAAARLLLVAWSQSLRGVVSIQEDLPCLRAWCKRVVWSALAACASSQTVAEEGAALEGKRWWF